MISDRDFTGVEFFTNFDIPETASLAEPAVFAAGMEVIQPVERHAALEL